MFTQLNHRIGRALIAAILPLSMSLGMVGNTFADVRWADLSTNQNLTARTYSVTMNGTTISVRFDRVTGNSITGTVLINTAECPFSAQADGQTVEGMFVYGGNDCQFTATIKGTVMYLDCLNTHLVLEQVS